jgi:hypothetical protein
LRIADEIGVSRMTVFYGASGLPRSASMASMTSHVAARRARSGRQDHRCVGDEDARNDAFSRDALEHALNGEGV